MPPPDQPTSEFSAREEGWAQGKAWGGTENFGCAGRVRAVACVKPRPGQPFPSIQRARDITGRPLLEISCQEARLSQVLIGLAQSPLGYCDIEKWLPEIVEGFYSGSCVWCRQLAETADGAPLRSYYLCSIPQIRPLRHLVTMQLRFSKSGWRRRRGDARHLRGWQPSR